MTTKTNPPAMAFGSKEWNEYYGLRHGSKRTGDKAGRARKAARHAMTKKGEAEFIEAMRPAYEEEAGKLAKAQQAEDRAEARILGPSGKAHAIKIAKPSGTFTPEDVKTFLEAGWEVHPAGTVAAKTGLALGAIAPWDVALNPSPDFAKLLGPKLEARALVLAHSKPAFSSDKLHEFRRAGYDVAAAPKALREGRKAAANPSAGDEKRVYDALTKAAKRGEAPTPEDLAEALKEAPDTIAERLANLARRGLAHPVPGGLFGSGWAPGAIQPALMFNPGQHAPGADTRTARGAEPGGMTKPRTYADFRQTLEAIERAMGDVIGKEVGGQIDVTCRDGGEKWTIHGEPKAVEKAIAYVETHGIMTLESKAHDEELGLTFAYLNSAKKSRKRAKVNPAKAPKTGRRASSAKGKKGAAKEPQEGKPRPEPSKVQPLKSPKADRYRLEKTVEALLDGAAQKPAKAKKAAKPEPVGVVESATVKIRFNPSRPEDVARVWKLWTGAKPGQVLKLAVNDSTGSLPEDVALLGRVAKFITPKGVLKDFGETGPLLVTDGQAKHVWLIDPKGQRFDLAPSIICYLARKPKFGDRGLVEYVHSFDRPARAQMAGQVGTLTGGFRLTPRGIEG